MFYRVNKLNNVEDYSTNYCSSQCPSDTKISNENIQNAYEIMIQSSKVPNKKRILPRIIKK